MPCLFLARTRARARAVSPSPHPGAVPFPLPQTDLIPQNIPDVPLLGTESAPLSAFLAWHAEIDAATLECSDAAAGLDAATFAKGATMERLHAAIAAHNAADTRESNAKARSSIALKRRQITWGCYVELLAAARSDTGSSSPSVVSASPPVVPSLTGASFSDVEDEDGEFGNDVFEGIPDDLGGVGEFDAGDMALSRGYFK